MRWKRNFKLMVIVLICLFFVQRKSHYDDMIKFALENSKCNFDGSGLKVDSDVQWSSKLKLDLINDTNDACLAIRMANDVAKIHNVPTIMFQLENRMEQLMISNTLLVKSGYSRANSRYIINLPKLGTNRMKRLKIFPLERPKLLGTIYYNVLNDIEEVDLERLDRYQFVLFRNSMEIFDHLVSCLEHGTIPVLVHELGCLRDCFKLPFPGILDLNKAVVYFSSSDDIVLYLKNLKPGLVAALKIQGQKIYENYFSSRDALFDTTLVFILEKWNILVPFHEVPSSFDALSGKRINVNSHDKLKIGTSSYFRWNKAFHPWNTAPNYPMSEPNLRGYDKIKGLRKAKFEAKFTGVVMTYQRHAILNGALEMFLGLEEFISRVIIVWNDAENPPESLVDLKLDHFNFTIRIVKMDTNSLNNRFIPFDIIDTDAIFMFDDDTRYLNKNMIKGAFRVWQEHQDQLVGFLGRDMDIYFDKSKGNWHYVSQMMCENSILLPMGLFLHRYYLYRYSYEMAPELRQKVDEVTNCDDIFLNGMVSDLTGKPGILAGKFKMYTCPNAVCSLNESNSISQHSGYKDFRHKCLDILEEHYGYLPLVPSRVYSQSLERGFCTQFDKYDYGAYYYGGSPVKNIGFLKMHKCGSTSIQNMLLRFADKNDLKVALPHNGHMIGYPRKFQSNMVKTEQPNIFCLHAVWNHQELEKIMPKDTKYFTILRDPVDRFLSFWNYFKMEQSQERTLEEFTRDYKGPLHKDWMPMVQEIGLNSSATIENIKSEINTNVDNNFDLVMIHEKWNESLVLVGDLLNFHIEDLVTLSMLGAENKDHLKVSKTTRQRLTQWLRNDYLLYNHFQHKFQRLKENFGLKKLKGRILELEDATEQVMKTCSIKPTMNKNLSGPQKHKFADDSVIGYHIGNNSSYCQNFGLTEKSFIEKIRIKQELRK